MDCTNKILLSIPPYVNGPAKANMAIEERISGASGNHPRISAAPNFLRPGLELLVSTACYERQETRH
jgi:hypothetical protein